MADSESAFRRGFVESGFFLFFLFYPFERNKMKGQSDLQAMGIEQTLLRGRLIAGSKILRMQKIKIKGNSSLTVSYFPTKSTVMMKLKCKCSVAAKG